MRKKQTPPKEGRDSLTPDEILRRRIELHQKRPIGEGDPNYDRHMLEQLVSEQVASIDGKRTWRLEKFEGANRLREVLDGNPLDLSVAQLGLSEMVTNALERYRVVWVRELVEWTVPMLLAVPMVGTKGIAEIQLVFGPLGLKLRQPAEGEEVHLPVAAPRPYSKKRYEPYAPNKTDENKRARVVVLGLADGVTPDAIVERLGTGRRNYEIINRTRDKLAGRVASGECPRAVARSLGFKFGNSSYKRAVSYLESLGRKT